MNELDARRKAHVTDHGPTQRTDRIGERRTEAEGKLLGRRTAARDRTLFENGDLVAGLRKIEGGRQSVMAGADHDDRAQRLPSLTMRSAAFRPGAPMIPPPGCV